MNFQGQRLSRTVQMREGENLTRLGVRQVEGTFTDHPWGTVVSKGHKERKGTKLSKRQGCDFTVQALGSLKTQQETTHGFYDQQENTFVFLLEWLWQECGRSEGRRGTRGTDQSEPYQNNQVRKNPALCSGKSRELLDKVFHILRIPTFLSIWIQICK